MWLLLVMRSGEGIIKCSTIRLCSIIQMFYNQTEQFCEYAKNHYAMFLMVRYYST